MSRTAGQRLTAQPTFDDVEPEETELERRLRDLHWPRPSPEIRDRVLARLKARLEAGEDAPPSRWDAARRAG